LMTWVAVGSSGIQWSGVFSQSKDTRRGAMG
jgi:hypothetical protein